MSAGRIRTALLVAGLALSGCAHVETRVVRLGRAEPPRPAGSVVTVRPPPLPAEAMPAREVALIEVTNSSSEWDGAVLEALRAAAREVGADVVLWMHEDRGDGFARVIASALRTRAAVGAAPAR